MKLPESITNKFGRQVLELQKNSPKIMFAVGIVGVVGGAVLACRATLRLDDKLDALEEDIAEAKNPDNVLDLEYDNGELVEKKHHASVAKVYVKHSVKIVKLYAPAVVVGGVSIALLTGAHVTLNRRNASLTAAYSGLHLAFEQYRERVKEKLGEEGEWDIRHGVTKTETKKDGTVVKHIDPNNISQYACFFDEGSRNWTNNPEANRSFLRINEAWFNTLLNSRGHVFLNEVLDNLDITRTSAGQMVGWLKNGNGDAYVSFGLFEPGSQRFINGIEASVLLDFNVDGVIYDKI